MTDKIIALVDELQNRAADWGYTNESPGSDDDLRAKAAMEQARNNLIIEIAAALAAMPGQDATIPVERAVEIIDKLCHENGVEQRAQFRLVHAIREAASPAPEEK